MRKLLSTIGNYAMSIERNFTKEDTRILDKLIVNAEREMAIFRKSEQYNKLALAFYYLTQKERKMVDKKDVFLNSYAIHYRDFDEMSYSIGGHPMATLYPVFKLLSPLKQNKITLLQGLKIEIALGKIFNPGLYHSQYHPTSIIGILGSTALSAKLLHLTTDQTVNALGIAFSFMSGVKGNFGSHAKALQVANATQNGLLSALCSKNGFTANIDLLQQNNVLKVFINKTIGTKEIKTLSRLLKKHLPLIDEFLFKKYDVCGSFHGVIDLALRDRKQLLLRINDIKEIRLRIHPKRLQNKHIELPQNALQKKFSPRYLYAYAFLGKDLRKITHSNIIYRDILRFIKKVKVIDDNTIDQWDYRSNFRWH
ncbi:MAG: MmgE/PrpD family protein [Candidatus Taylorbacteria bacterium]|nr:MmgE/PrpD family protein [Candidatus Taylorbacteria bacterium]